MNDSLVLLSNHFDQVVLDVLGPVRTQKRVDDAALARMISILDDLAEVLGQEEYVPRKLVGDLWYVFTAMLAEASHAKDPSGILSAAWQIQERLERIFGPS